MADGSPAASPITTAPSDDPERPLLLFCPEQGGWQMGVFFDGRWLDFAWSRALVCSESHGRLGQSVEALRA